MKNDRPKEEISKEEIFKEEMPKKEIPQNQQAVREVKSWVSTKRIFALIGVFALIALYISTLVFAIIGSEDTMMMFKASVILTIVVPALLWGYGLIYRLMKSDSKIKMDDSTDNDWIDEGKND